LRNRNPRRPRYTRGVLPHARRLVLASRLLGYPQCESGGRAARLRTQILQRPSRLSTLRSLRTMGCSTRLLSIARSRARATCRAVCVLRLYVQRATSCRLPCAFPRRDDVCPEPRPVLGYLILSSDGWSLTRVAGRITPVPAVRA
jgi:hypothetical protein